MCGFISRYGIASDRYSACPASVVASASKPHANSVSQMGRPYLV